MWHIIPHHRIHFILILKTIFFCRGYHPSLSDLVYCNTKDTPFLCGTSSLTIRFCLLPYSGHHLFVGDIIPHHQILFIVILRTSLLWLISEPTIRLCLLPYLGHPLLLRDIILHLQNLSVVIPWTPPFCG